MAAMMLPIALTLVVTQAAAPAPTDPVEARFLAIDAVARKADFKTATAMAKAFDDEVLARKPFDPALRYRTLRLYRAMVSRVDGEASYALLPQVIALVDTHFSPRDSRRVQAHYDMATTSFARRKPGATLAAVEAAAIPLADIAQTESERVSAGQALASLATDMAAAGDFARARPVAARALALADTVTARTQRLGRIYGYLARYEATLGDLKAAIALCERAIAIFESENFEAHSNIPPTLGNAANFAARLGDYRAAEAYLMRALRLVDANPGFSADVRIRTMYDYGVFLTDTQRFDLALPLLERAVRMADASFTGPQPIKEALARALGNAYLEAGFPGDSARQFERGVAMLSVSTGGARSRGMLRLDLARAEIVDGRFDAAQAALHLAAKDFIGLPAKDDAVLMYDTLSARLAAESGDAAGAVQRYEAVAARFDPARQSALRSTAILSAGEQRAKIGTVDAASWARARQATDATIRTSADIRAIWASTADQRRLRETLDSALDIAWATRAPARRR